MSNFVTRETKPRNLFARTGALAALVALSFMTNMLASGTIAAQSNDLPRADLVEQLNTQYAEAQAAVGVTDEGGVSEVFTTKDGETWTLVLTKPNGTSRVVAAGETWIKR